MTHNSDEQAPIESAGIIEHLRLFLSPLAELFDDSSVSEIVVNGHQEVFVERAGRMESVSSHFEDAGNLDAALRAIAQSLDRPFDAGTPILEGRLPDGSRIQAIHGSLVKNGACLAIRRHRQMQMKLSDWVSSGCLSQAHFSLLSQAVARKENILVSGGTGTGKSTFVSSLAAAIPVHERVIVIEDNRELSLTIPHQVSLEARGAVSVEDLFRASLRLRPDRIVIGEIRGPEALSLIAAMTSGHGGCLSTIHASSPLDALRRLETLALGGQHNLPHLAIREQAESAIDWVVQIKRTTSGKREVVEVVSRSEMAQRVSSDLAAQGEGGRSDGRSAAGDASRQNFNSATLSESDLSQVEVQDVESAFEQLIRGTK